MTTKTITINVAPQFDQLSEVWISGAGPSTLGGMSTEYVCQTASQVEALTSKVVAAVEKTNAWCASAPWCDYTYTVEVVNH